MDLIYEAQPSREQAARQVAAVAAERHGVFSRAQARACGMSLATIDRRLTSGVWERLYPGVYRLAGAPATWQQALLAACLALGADAVVSHRAAAALWLFPGFAQRGIELSVPRGRWRMRGLKVHRPVSLP